MSIVEFRKIAKRYGKKMVLRSIDLAVESGDFMVVFGLPVSGKSVLVRLLTGLEPADAGQILLRGVDATQTDAGMRNIGYVPQSFALYPHFTVRQNISYPLDLARTPKREIEPAVQRVASLLGIEPLLERKPDQLSGGQKQRVAIARGLVKQTDFYILDDPLVGLDFKLRERLIDDLKRTQEVLKVTFLYTTSDAVEAMMLGSKIAVLADGEIVEVERPERLYQHPQRVETLRYLCFPQSNLFTGNIEVNAGKMMVKSRFFQFPADLSLAALQQNSLANNQGEVQIGVRPEHIRIGKDIARDWVTCQANVLLREDLGGEEIVYLEASDQSLRTVLRNDDDSQQHVEIDQQVTIGMKPSDLVIFSNGQRIGTGKS